jgi:glycosyltransferase involved in cell wall biosynthesis
MKKCAFKRVKFVVKAHGTAVPELRANRYRGIKGAVLSLNAVLHRWHDTFVLKQADVVLCSSEFQRQEMISIYGLPSDGIRCMYNGYDPQFVNSAEYGRHAPGDLCHRVVFCGRVVPKKGLQYAISLFQKVARDVPDARLLMLLGKREEVEDPSTYADVQSAARRDQRIEIKHDLSESELYAEFGKATLGLITSENYESIPTVLLEMVSCGLPVFATYAWGIPEVLPEGFGLSGEIERDASKILSFSEDPAAERKTFEVTSFVRQRFDYRVLVREYLSLYEELAQSALGARKHSDTRG